MSFLRLAFRFSFRNRLRSLVTALGVAVTLLAFLLLRTLVANWYASKEKMSLSERVFVRHAITITSPLYTRQAERIRALPGVLDVSWMCWFAGYYKDERNRFSQRAVEAESFVRLYPEFRPPPEQLDDWLADPAGAIVGQQLADKYGWKIGDNITLTGTIYPGEWPMTVRGVYRGDAEGTDRARLYFHWKYLNEKARGGNHVQRILARIDRPEVAQDIDSLFANSRAPTKTESELALEQQWASWSTAMVDTINVASGLMLAVLMLVLGNSMAMDTRDASREYATLRAIGYTAQRVTALVIVQGLFVTFTGVASGVALAPIALRAATHIMEGQIGGVWALELQPAETVISAVLALTAGMFASWLPAWHCGRLAVVEALRAVA